MEFIDFTAPVIAMPTSSVLVTVSYLTLMASSNGSQSKQNFLSLHFSLGHETSSAARHTCAWLLSLAHFTGHGEINQFVKINRFTFKLAAQEGVLQSLLGSDTVSGRVGDHEIINVVDGAGLDAE